MSKGTAVEYLKSYFYTLRFSEYHHLGLGDIRLTLGQQQDLITAIEKILEDD